jgi:hypothetical protein
MKRRVQVRGEVRSEGRGRGRHSSRLGWVALAVASLWALSAAGAAQASTVTIGSVLPTMTGSEKFEQVHTLFNTALPETGANLVSPVNGAIVRWRIQGAKGGPFYLRVLRPNGKGAYEAVGTSLGGTPLNTGLQTFSTSLPVKAGDLIGVDPTNATDEIGFAEVSGAKTAFLFPTPAEGATAAPSGTGAGKEIELSAEVQSAPAITVVSPNSGSVIGGTKVTITGTNLAGASAVKFGETPAASFTVESETKVTATAPRSAKVGRVDITATTLAGTSATVSADAFTYKGCVVPSLLGKTLKVAKNKIKRAGCKLGTVKKVNAAPRKKGKVVRQAPKSKKVRAPGTKVNIKLGK